METFPLRKILETVSPRLPSGYAGSRPSEGRSTQQQERDRMDKCKECGREVEPLAMFPKGRCLECHAKAHENDTPEQMFADIMRGFGR